MSKAIKCDRCGTCFNPRQVEGGVTVMSFYNPKITEYNTMAANASETKAITRFLYTDLMMDDRIDLCEKCKDDFIAFMIGK